MRLPSSCLAVLLGALASLSAAGTARAGDFNAAGELVADPAAIAFVDFESEPARYLPDDTEVECIAPAFTLAQAEDALDGEGFARVQAPDNCAERFSVELPKTQGSYRATAWIRHGKAIVSFIVLYADDSGLAQISAQMGPTGRTTSDGWVEMASNDFPVDGALVKVAYLRVIDYAAAEAVDLDSVEVVPSGEFEAQKTCSGARDPVCGEGLCIHGSCAVGRLAVPPLPVDALRNDMVDMLAERVRLFFGGARSRREALPESLATIESMRSAKTAWQFWGGFAHSIRQLRDWHTSINLPLGGDPKYRLSVCFIEGDADRSHDIWPKHPLYSDILVSHVGGNSNAGLRTGDRLVAVDGQHPIEWARSLVDVDPGFHAATDPEVFADFVESLGGPSFGGALIIKYAKNITVIRCDSATGECTDKVETIDVSTLVPEGQGGQGVRCDNRPFYHFEGDENPPPNHSVDFGFFDGKIAGTTDEEAVYGVVWDTLYGGGDPNGYVNGNLKQLMTFWKASARGVILDHRAGNGGTLDSPELLTTLVRPPETLAVVPMPIAVGGDDGPDDTAEGKAVFATYKNKAPYEVGGAAHDPLLPVALVLHRDGSASDYLPLGMKGAPGVRIFGPHGTAGAFSTYVALHYHGVIDLQFASGDTITSDGTAWIGHGVVPDEIVNQKQSDLLAGRDSIHEAALAWVRANLKEVQ